MRIAQGPLNQLKNPIIKFNGGDNMGRIIVGLIVLLIIMLVFYMIIKAAVRNGVIEAHEETNQLKRKSK